MGLRAREGVPAATALSYSSTCKYLPVWPLSTIARKPSLTLSAVRTPFWPAFFGKVTVSTMPGEMEFTRMPLSLSSSAIVAVMPSRANLEAQYRPFPTRPTLPARDETLTISPWPAFNMAWCRTALDTMRTLATFKFMRLWKSLGDCLCNGFFVVLPPTLLTRRSMPPNCATTAAMAASTSSSLVTSAVTDMNLPPYLEVASSFTVCNCAGDRASMATSAPSSAHNRAMALPMPRPPPVTRTLLPASRLLLGAAVCNKQGDMLLCRAVLQRLPPAHSMTVNAAGAKSHGLATLPPNARCTPTRALVVAGTCGKHGLAPLQRRALAPDTLAIIPNSRLQKKN
mmetsp:Transcript_99542/g.192220  ORF Transcript_99542/g.192220 Transcript_99542/m.192220 type:complete len:341 (-) Transcript_99542:8-1030(-)